MNVDYPDRDAWVLLENSDIEGTGGDQAGLSAWLEKEGLAPLVIPEWMGSISYTSRDSIFSTTEALSWTPLYGSYLLDSGIQGALAPNCPDFLMAGSVGGFACVYGKLGSVVVLIQWSDRRGEEPAQLLVSETWNGLVARATRENSNDSARILVSHSTERHGAQVFLHGAGNHEDAYLQGHMPSSWEPLRQTNRETNSLDLLSLSKTQKDEACGEALLALYVLTSARESWLEQSKAYRDRISGLKNEAENLNRELEEFDQRVASAVESQTPWVPNSYDESGWKRLARYAVAVRGQSHLAHLRDDDRHMPAEAECVDSSCAIFRAAMRTMKSQGELQNSSRRSESNFQESMSADILISEIMTDTASLSFPFVFGDFHEVPGPMFVAWIQQWRPKIESPFNELVAAYEDFLAEMFRFMYPAGYGVDLSVTALARAGFVIPQQVDMWDDI